MTRDQEGHAGSVSGFERPSVGVVIPVHNGEDFLAEALESLERQEEQVTQVIIVDDCSTDGSVDVARRWQESLPLEIVRLGEQSGVSAARNAGAARLTTQLLAFLDADDVWEPRHLRVVVDAYIIHGGLISPGALLWYPDGATRSFQRWLGLRVPRGKRQLPSLLQQNFVFIGALLPRTDFEAVGGFREPNIGEDWDLWIRLLARGLRVTQLREPTVRYRRHGNNTTSERGAMIPSIVTILERAEQELGAQYGPDVRRSIAAHLGELELEERLADESGEGRMSWSAVRAGLRANNRVRVKTLAYTIAPGLAQRISPDRR